MEHLLLAEPIEEGFEEVAALGAEGFIE